MDIARHEMDFIRQDIQSATMPFGCRSCEARQAGVCGALTPQQLMELSRHSARKTIAAGSEIIGQGELVTSYHNVLKGVVKLTKLMSDGRQQIVGLQFSPDFVGRPFAGESTLTAETAVETELCMVPRRVVERMIAETPGLERRLHTQALNELDEARDWMLTLGRKSAQEKVASFLYLIATRIDPDIRGKATFDLPLSRADIADFLGLTIETVSRQMTKLRKLAVIRIENNRHIIVDDLRALNRASGNGA